AIIRYPLANLKLLGQWRRSPVSKSEMPFSSNRHLALVYWRRMIPRVEPEGMLFRKPVSTFQDHALGLAINDRVGPLSCCIELRLERAPRSFQGLRIGIGGNADGLADDNRAAAERQVDRRAIPIIEDDPAARRKRNRIDRAARLARQRDDAEAGDPRNLGNIGSQSHVRAFRQRLQHAFERGDPALAGEAALMVAGAANGAYSQPFSGDRIDLAVAVTGDQYLYAVVTPKEWRHEMLTVP